MTKGRAEDAFKKAVRPITQACPKIFLRNLLDLTHFGVAEPGCDFQLSLGTLLVECKNTSRDGVLVDRPSDRQTNQLEKYGGYVFLGMWDEGYPVLPKGADFYLLPWDKYKEYVLANMDVMGTSFRRHEVRYKNGNLHAIGASTVIPEEYKCNYVRGVGVEIPSAHVFWRDCASILKEVNTVIEGVISKDAKTDEAK